MISSRVRVTGGNNIGELLKILDIKILYHTEMMP